jgi:hypothetical protein
MTTHTETLPVPLTDEELRSKAAELAVLIRQWENDEEAEKQRAKLAREELAEKWETVRRVRAIVEAKAEPRSVECEERPAQGRTIMVVRLDTGEIVRSRPMTSDECQASLDLGTGKRRGKLIAIDPTGDER